MLFLCRLLFCENIHAASEIVRNDCHVTQEVPKKRPSASKPPPKSKKAKNAKKAKEAKEESEAEEASEEELEASTEGSFTECDAFCFWCNVLPKPRHLSST